MLKMPL